MQIALVTPLHYDVTGNPGWFFITDGMKWLMRQVDPAVTFLPVDMIRPDEAGWRIVMQQADCVILAGNPRFNWTEATTYWDWDVWRPILKAIEAGIPFVDGWAGGSHPPPLRRLDEMVAALARLRKTQQLLEFEAKAGLCIARDAVAYHLLRRANSRTYLLPCSSWFAARWHHVAASRKDCHAINVRCVPGEEWIVDRLVALQRVLSHERPTYLIAHAYGDYAWAKSVRPDIPNLILSNDPESLLRLYARVDKLLSFRLHATIPALSLGARVCDMAIDSRSLAVREFGVHSTPYTDLRRADFEPRFQPAANEPDMTAIGRVLRQLVDRK